MERRREHRVVVRGTGMLSWTEGRHTRTEFVDVENVAGDGVRIRLLTHLRVLQLVRLSGLRYECEATVRYCRRDDTEWTAGLEVTNAVNSNLPVKYGF